METSSEKTKSPTSIPEITESQITTMTQVCYDPNMSVFTQAYPIPGDPMDMSIAMERSTKDTEHLCSLGFLRDITADHQARLDELKISSGREWRVFEITPMGRAMFQTTKGKPN